MVSDSDAESEKKPTHILDEVLEEPEDPISRRVSHPVWVDILLAVGLLVIMGAFSAGLIKMYVSHSAEQSITQRNYQVAIALLEGAPFPDLFSPPGSEPRELLNQALYLDAMEKLDAYSEDSTAIKELEKIDASSRFFELAQEILKEHFKPSSIQLQVGAEQQIEKAQPSPAQTEVPHLNGAPDNHDKFSPEPETPASGEANNSAPATDRNASPADTTNNTPAPDASADTSAAPNNK